MKDAVVITIWLLCAAIMAVNAIGLRHLSSYSPPDHAFWALAWLWYSWPYLLVPLTACIARHHPRALCMLLAGVVMIGALGTWTRYLAFQEILDSLVAIQQGHRVMNCAPPVRQIYIAGEGLATFVYIMISLSLGNRRPSADFESIVLCDRPAETPEA